MPRNFKPTPLSDEERAERRQREQDLTEQAVAQLRSSDGWQRWLKVRSQVGTRRYSFRNCCLIAMQDPEAQFVAGFRAWLTLGYSVRRGEASRIRIWAPNPPSKKKMQAWRDAGANPQDRPKTYFRLEAVFSQDQVEPLAGAVPVPLGPQIVEVQGDSLAWALPVLEQFARDLGYTVVHRPLRPGHGGSCNYDTRVIEINNDQAINAQVDVACHELAHALTKVDRHDGDPVLDYAASELVAESVAHLGLSVDDRRSAQLTSWGSASVMGPQVSMTSASAALAVWKP